ITFIYKMFSGIDFLFKRTMSSFFDAIKNLLTAYHTDKSSTGKIIEPIFYYRGLCPPFLCNKKPVNSLSY
ncbi:hypothetical protein, partial [Lactobacillus helveticus]|uniref:hypothetical protein n=1 Tax=Lactobacillus helveticus TaxID=1587 RepID=UPI001C2C3511